MGAMWWAKKRGAATSGNRLRRGRSFRVWVKRLEIVGVIAAIIAVLVAVAAFALQWTDFQNAHMQYAVPHAQGWDQPRIDRWCRARKVHPEYHWVDGIPASMQVVIEHVPDEGETIRQGDSLEVWMGLPGQVAQQDSRDSKVRLRVFRLQSKEEEVGFIDRKVTSFRMLLEFENKTETTVTLPPLVLNDQVVGHGGRHGKWVLRYAGEKRSRPPLLTGGAGWNFQDKPLELPAGERVPVIVAIEYPSTAPRTVEFSLGLGVASGQFSTPMMIDLAHAPVTDLEHLEEATRSRVPGKALAR